MLIRVMLMIACIVVALPSYAQEVGQKPSWMPKVNPESVDLFVNIRIAKISQDKKSILFATPTYQRMSVAETVKASTATETRTRSDALTLQTHLPRGSERQLDLLLCLFTTC